MSSDPRESYEDRVRDYGDTRTRTGVYSEDYEERVRAERARAERVKGARERIHEAPPPPPREERARQAEAKKAKDLFDDRLVRNQITVPPKEARRVHILLVDNSGSNRKIAEHFRQSTGYLLATLGSIDPEGAIAVVYFSDHFDGPLLRQDVDYVMSNERGEKILFSTTRKVQNADGDDLPEAIECILANVCDLKFGHVSQEQRHLYLVTDVVAHGMGMRGDKGCPFNQRWQDSVERVRQMFATFQVIGCDDRNLTGRLQEQFLDPARRVWDLIDLSDIKSDEHRRAITLNAALFLIARNMGQQTLLVFLMALYEKWLSEPIFGQATDLQARVAIDRFLKFVEASPEIMAEMRERIFVA